MQETDPIEKKIALQTGISFMAIEGLTIFSLKLRKAKNLISYVEDQAGIFCLQDGRFFVELYVENHFCQRSKSQTKSGKQNAFLPPDILPPHKFILPYKNNY